MSHHPLLGCLYASVQVGSEDHQVIMRDLNGSEFLPVFSNIQKLKTAALLYGFIFDSISLIQDPELFEKTLSNQNIQILLDPHETTPTEPVYWN